MKAIRVEKLGGPEVLKLLAVAPLDAPGPGQASPKRKGWKELSPSGSPASTTPVAHERLVEDQIPITAGIRGRRIHRR